MQSQLIDDRYRLAPKPYTYQLYTIDLSSSPSIAQFVTRKPFAHRVRPNVPHHNRYRRIQLNHHERHPRSSR